MSTNFLGNSFYDGCIGCGIVKEKFCVPGGSIFENNSFVLHQDPEYPIATFFIITAKRHFKHFYEMTDLEYNDYMEIVKFTREMLKKLDIADEYAIINEERSNHFHTWFFPRLTWMDNFGHSISEVRNIMKYAQQNMNNDNNIKEVMNYIKEAKKIVVSNN